MNLANVIQQCGPASGRLGPVLCHRYLAAPEPTERNYSQEYAKNLQTQIAYAPKLYAARANEQYGDPAYTRLGLRTLDTSVNGTADTPGFLSILGNAAPAIQRIASETASSQRAADVADVERLGPRAKEALRASNPESYGLVDKLTEQARAGLAAGSLLTPEDLNTVQENTRRVWANRGLGGEAAGASEVLATLGAGRAEQDRRRQFAAGTVALNQAVYGDPFQQIVGRNSGTTSSGMAALQGAAGQQATSVFNPESGYSAALNTHQQDLTYDSDTARANNQNAITKSAMQVGSAALGGMGV